MPRTVHGLCARRIGEGVTWVLGLHDTRYCTSTITVGGTGEMPSTDHDTSRLERGGYWLPSQKALRLQE